MRAGDRKTDSLYQRYVRICMAMFDPEYLAAHPIMDEADFDKLIDEIVKLKESSMNYQRWMHGDWPK